MDELESRVFGVLPDETWVLPRPRDDTTLGKERPKPPGVARAVAADHELDDPYAR
jgi:hypothetical protein